MFFCKPADCFRYCFGIADRHDLLRFESFYRTVLNLTACRLGALPVPFHSELLSPGCDPGDFCCPGDNGKCLYDLVGIGAFTGDCNDGCSNACIVFIGNSIVSTFFEGFLV